MNKRNIFIFWGLMDLGYLLGIMFVVVNNALDISHDNLALLIWVVTGGGNKIVIAALLGFLLLCASILVSMIMFFVQHRFASLLGYIQVPFRLLMITPSLPFIPWLISLIELKNMAIALSLLVASEILKVASLWWVGKSKRKAISENI